MVEELITAKYLEVDSGEVFHAEITIEDGFFKDVIPIVGEDEDLAGLELDYEGILIPGFIDSHIHIESSKLTPSNFAKAVLPSGTTSVIADSHEIANVLGIEGVDFMVENGKNVPFDFYFAAPSCVPATTFETAGAVLDSNDIEELLSRDEFVALGEMMNFPGVINEDPEVIRKLEIANEKGKAIDGHAPLVSGEDLEKYMSYGISTDHECSNIEEAFEKKNKGMKIMVREGSSAKDMDALLNENDRLNFWLEYEQAGNDVEGTLEENLSKSPFEFLVSDDINAKDLLNGHLNLLVKKAVAHGISVSEAIKMVTINPADHYGLNSGLIAPERVANYFLVDNLEDLNIKKVWVHGELVFDEGEILFEIPECELVNNFKLEEVTPTDFDVIFEEGRESSLMDQATTVNVIIASNGELITGRSEENVFIKDNILQANLKNDILKIAVLNRYGGSNITNGFIKGFGLNKGAIASSVAHDSHNVIVVGTNSEDMAKAVNLIVENKGGVAVACDDYEEVLGLPIAGLMSNEDSAYVAEKLQVILELTKKLGCSLDSPFMTLSFMALLVIPSLKISDQGLFDLNEFAFVDLIK